MLSRIAISTLAKLGAVVIQNADKDPDTEEEFLQLSYTPNDLAIPWDAYKAMYDTQRQRIELEALREKRDALLAKSDWILQSDVWAGIANKEEWLVYRQALRDLPSTPLPTFPQRPDVIRLNVT